MNRSTSSLAVSRWAGGVFNKFTLLSLAITSILMFLVSCGDTVYESKGGSGSTEATTGTINVHVRNGGDNSVFSTDNQVEVTLLNGSATRTLKDGSVSFTNVPFGIYEVKVSHKSGEYATSYYTVKLDKYDAEVGSNTYNGGVVSVPGVLYPLTASLSGKLTYKKPDGSAGNAGLAKVYLEVGIERRSEVRDLVEDIKIEERTWEATANENGVYTFTGLPAVGNLYKLVALSKDFGGVAFSDAEIGEYATTSPEHPDLKAGVTTTAKTYAAYTDPVGQLLLVSYPLSVSGSDPIKFTFNEDLPAIDSIGASVISVSEVVDRAISGKELTITPRKAWQADVVVKFRKLYSKIGSKFEDDDVTVTLTGSGNKFRITNDIGGVIYLRDSTEAIVLEFSHEVDNSNPSAAVSRELTDGGQPYTLKIEGKTVTLTPASGFWNTAPPTLTLGSLISKETLKRFDADAVDGVPVAETPTVQYIDARPAFSIVKDEKWTNDEITVALADTGKAIVLAFSDEPGPAPVGKTREVRIGTLNGEGVAVGGSLVNGVTYTGKTISIPGPWKNGQFISLGNFQSVGGITLGGKVAGVPYIITIKSEVGGPFELVKGQDSIVLSTGETGWATKGITLEFSDAVDATDIDLKIKAVSSANGVRTEVGTPPVLCSQEEIDASVVADPCYGGSTSTIKTPAVTINKDAQIQLTTKTVAGNKVTVTPRTGEAWPSPVFYIWVEPSLRSVSREYFKPSAGKGVKIIDESVIVVKDKAVDSVWASGTIKASSKTFNLNWTPVTVGAGNNIKYLETYVITGRIGSTVKWTDTVTVTGLENQKVDSATTAEGVNWPAAKFGFTENDVIGSGSFTYDVVPYAGTATGLSAKVKALVTATFGFVDEVEGSGPGLPFPHSTKIAEFSATGISQTFNTADRPYGTPGGWKFELNSINATAANAVIETGSQTITVTTPLVTFTVYFEDTLKVSSAVVTVPGSIGGLIDASATVAKDEHGNPINALMVSVMVSSSEAKKILFNAISPNAERDVIVQISGLESTSGAKFATDIAETDGVNPVKNSVSNVRFGWKFVKAP